MTPERSFTFSDIEAAMSRVEGDAPTRHRLVIGAAFGWLKAALAEQPVNHIDPDAVAEMGKSLMLILAAVWMEAPDLNVFARNPELADKVRALVDDLKAAEADTLENLL